MADEAEIVSIAAYRAEREEYKRRRTERHKQRLLAHAKEGTPMYPGGIDDMDIG